MNQIIQRAAAFMARESAPPRGAYLNRSGGGGAPLRATLDRCSMSGANQFSRDATSPPDHVNHLVVR